MRQREQAIPPTKTIQPDEWRKAFRAYFDETHEAAHQHAAKLGRVFRSGRKTVKAHRPLR